MNDWNDSSKRLWYSFNSDADNDSGGGDEENHRRWLLTFLHRKDSSSYFRNETSNNSRLRNWKKNEIRSHLRKVLKE